MNLRIISIILINSIILLSCASTHKVYLEGENQQALGYTFHASYLYDPSTKVFDAIFSDSSGNRYNGIATKLLYPRKDRYNLKKSELDSLCISDGLINGYSKTYAPANRETALIITYINGNQFRVKNDSLLNTKYKIDVFYDLSVQPRKMVHANIEIYKHNVRFYSSIKQSMNTFKVKVSIERTNDNLGYKYFLKSKHKTRLKEKSTIEDFLMLYPEIVSQEIIEKCRNLGMFDNKQYKDPIIEGNCSRNKRILHRKSIE